MPRKKKDKAIQLFLSTKAVASFQELHVDQYEFIKKWI